MPKKVITNIDDLDLSRRYTYGDYLMWRFQERVELIRGWIARMSKAPKLKHQKTSMELVRSFLRSVNERPGGCHVFAAPFDVILVEAGGRPEEAESVVQPDLCVVCDPHKLEDRGCMGAPDLVVEILSESTAKRDYNDKFRLYEENGVQEYWIASPMADTMEIYHRDERDRFVLLDLFDKRNTMVRGRLFPDLEIFIGDIYPGMEIISPEQLKEEQRPYTRI